MRLTFDETTALARGIGQVLDDVLPALSRGHREMLAAAMLDAVISAPGVWRGSVPSERGERTDCDTADGADR